MAKADNAKHKTKVDGYKVVNHAIAGDGNEESPVMSVSANPHDTINPYGESQMRGYGAATKGRKTSGKLA